MKALPLAAALVAMSAAIAAAATLQLPLTGKPSATLTVPDTWSQKVGDDGVEITSDDQEIFLTVDTNPRPITNDELIKEVSEGIGKGEDFTIDRTTMKSRTGQINGMDATFIDFDVTQQQTTLKCLVTQVVTPTPGVVVFVLEMGTTESKQQHRPDLDAITQSLKAIR